MAQNQDLSLAESQSWNSAMTPIHHPNPQVVTPQPQQQQQDPLHFYYPPAPASPALGAVVDPSALVGHSPQEQQPVVQAPVPNRGLPLLQDSSHRLRRSTSSIAVHPSHQAHPYSRDLRMPPSSQLSQEILLGRRNSEPMVQQVQEGEYHHHHHQQQQQQHLLEGIDVYPHPPQAHQHYYLSPPHDVNSGSDSPIIPPHPHLQAPRAVTLTAATVSSPSLTINPIPSPISNPNTTNTTTTSLHSQSLPPSQAEAGQGQATSGGTTQVSQPLSLSPAGIEISPTHPHFPPHPLARPHPSQPHGPVVQTRVSRLQGRHPIDGLGGVSGGVGGNMGVNANMGGSMSVNGSGNGTGTATTPGGIVHELDLVQGVDSLEMGMSVSEHMVHHHPTMHPHHPHHHQQAHLQQQGHLPRQHPQHPHQQHPHQQQQQREHQHQQQQDHLRQQHLQRQHEHHLQQQQQQQQRELQVQQERYLEVQHQQMVMHQQQEHHRQQQEQQHRQHQQQQQYLAMAAASSGIKFEPSLLSPPPLL
ncbi:hypothetical protein CC2G_006567 [Coprinopsis cinerea AmutBmut pab1-1]|nr:hypothetical protein CC2G_006567 [Coprinopsis cinerea AmutBmut pab1-1]